LYLLQESLINHTTRSLFGDHVQANEILDKLMLSIMRNAYCDIYEVSLDTRQQLSRNKENKCLLITMKQSLLAQQYKQKAVTMDTV
jgi:hypothetical protein